MGMLFMKYNGNKVLFKLLGLVSNLWLQSKIYIHS